jgi:hypothetical protein
VGIGGEEIERLAALLFNACATGALSIAVIFKLESRKLVEVISLK